MLRPKREQQRVVGGRGLELEIELAAEALTQREPPGLVDTASERRVQHELHAAGFIEEALEHERLLRRDDTKRPVAFSEVVDDLLGGAVIQAGFGYQPGAECLLPPEGGSHEVGMAGRHEVGMAGRHEVGMAGRREVGMGGSREFGMGGSREVGMDGSYEVGMAERY